MKLVYEENGHEVQVGDDIVSFRGEPYTVTGWREPQHAGSTGRVYVKPFDNCADGFGKNSIASTREFFPSVFDLKFV